MLKFEAKNLALRRQRKYLGSIVPSPGKCMHERQFFSPVIVAILSGAMVVAASASSSITHLDREFPLYSSQLKGKAGAAGSQSPSSRKQMPIAEVLVIILVILLIVLFSLRFGRCVLGLESRCSLVPASSVMLFPCIRWPDFCLISSCNAKSELYLCLPAPKLF